MISYILRRFAYMLLLLLAVSVISFLIIQLPPGDYITSYAMNLQASGMQVTTERLQALRLQYGLDKPAIVQYLYWLRNVLRGDLGYSFQWQAPVATLIGERIGLTILVSVVTLIFTWIVSLPIAIYSATHQYSPLDYFFTFVGFIGVATPNFLLALVLAYAMFRLTGLGSIGLFSPEYMQAPWSWAKLLNLFRHLWLPVIIVGVGGTAGLIRVLRGCILDELSKPYVVTARAKGLSEWHMLLKYPIRIALNPLISTIGWALPAIVSGTVLVDIILNLQMAGTLLLRALLAQDMFLAASFVLILSALTVVGTFVSDMLLVWADPRIRFE